MNGVFIGIVEQWRMTVSELDQHSTNGEGSTVDKIKLVLYPRHKQSLGMPQGDVI